MTNNAGVGSGKLKKDYPKIKIPSEYFRQKVVYLYRSTRQGLSNTYVSDCDRRGTLLDSPNLSELFRIPPPPSQNYDLFDGEVDTTERACLTPPPPSPNTPHLRS